MAPLLVIFVTQIQCHQLHQLKLMACVCKFGHSGMHDCSEIGWSLRLTGRWEAAAVLRQGDWRWWASFNSILWILTDL